MNWKRCQSNFAKMFKSGGFNQASESVADEEFEEVPENDNDEDSSSKTQEENKFNFIITEKDEPGEGKELPLMIKLKSTNPKETPFMHKRKYPTALRYHKINKNNSPAKYFLSELLMYVPFRDESEFLYNNDEEIEKIFHANEDRIKSIKGKVMEHLEDVEEARYYVEEAQKKLDLEEIGKKLDAAKEQDNAECQNEEEQLHPDYAHIDKEHVENYEETVKQETSIYRKVDIPDHKE